MFHVDPSAWATVVGVLIVCISLFVAIAKKVERKLNKPTLLWLSIQIGTHILAALMAYEIYPHIPTVVKPDWMTRTIFVALAAWLGSKFIDRLEKGFKLKF